MTSIIRTEFAKFSHSLYDAPGGHRQALSHWQSLAELARQTSFIPLQTNVNSVFGRRGFMALACYALDTENIALFHKVCEDAAAWEESWFTD